MLHPLTQWVDGRLRDSRIHGEFLLLKELRTQTRLSTAQSLNLPRYIAARDSPAKRVRAS